MEIRLSDLYEVVDGVLVFKPCVASKAARAIDENNKLAQRYQTLEDRIAELKAEAEKIEARVSQGGVDRCLNAAIRDYKNSGPRIYPVSTGACLLKFARELVRYAVLAIESGSFAGYKLYDLHRAALETRDSISEVYEKYKEIHPIAKRIGPLLKAEGLPAEDGHAWLQFVITGSFPDEYVQRIKHRNYNSYIEQITLNYETYIRESRNLHTDPATFCFSM